MFILLEATDVKRNEFWIKARVDSAGSIGARIGSSGVRNLNEYSDSDAYASGNSASYENGSNSDSNPKTDGNSETDSDPST